MNQQEFDVAVIGAGPMGSFASERMAREGLRVGLFEKDLRPGDSTVCAGGMHYDVLRFVGLPDSLIERVLFKLRLVAVSSAHEALFLRCARRDEIHPGHLTSGQSEESVLKF